MFKKILILRFGAIGDIIHSSELFRSIKRKYPDISIHYAAFKTPSLNIQNDPDLDKVWVVPGKSYAELYKLAKEMKKEKFDAFINLQPGIRTKIFSLMLNVPKTITYKKTFKLHAVENFWQTGKKLFKDIEINDELKLYISEDIRNKAVNMLNKTCKVIAFNMGVSPTRQGRRWSQKYWGELAQKILQQYDCEIIITGSKEDQKFSEPLLDISDKIHSFCGKTSIEENTALLSLCDLAISGDTGPLHIAAAVGIPVIGIYGAAPISRTGPYGKNCEAIHSNRFCIPCNRRKCKYLVKGEVYTPCMLDIKPEQILKAVQKYL